MLTGFCGGFTTFSAFGRENLAFIHNGQFGAASAYIAASVVGGIALVWLGCWLSNKW